MICSCSEEKISEETRRIKLMLEEFQGTMYETSKNLLCFKEINMLIGKEIL